MDNRLDDAITLLPGTFVGRLSPSTHSALDSSFTDGRWLTPACPAAYLVSYSALDLASDFFNGTPDLDVDADTAVAAAGNTDATVAATTPVGVITHPFYAGWIPGTYENYDIQLNAAWMSGGAIFRMPALTANEKLIEPGDVVMLDDTSTPDYDPIALLATGASTPGRIMVFDDTVANVKFKVGRCVNKIRLGRQASYVANQSLRTAIGTGAPRTLTNLNSTTAYLWPTGENFEPQSKVEVVPGTGLSASSQTMGRPSELLFALPDSNGDYWALDIELAVA